MKKMYKISELPFSDNWMADETCSAENTSVTE